MKSSFPVFVFSGQGSFKPGFGKKYFQDETFRNRFNEVSEAVGTDLSEFAWGKSSTQTVQYNGRLQITHFALAWALAHSTQKYIGRPQLVLGYSLGEICSLVFSGAIPMAEGAKLIHLRGKLVEKATENVPQDLLVIFSALDVRIETALSERADLTIYICNLNSSSQIVLAGAKADLSEFSKWISARFQIGSKFLGVGVGFHSPLLLGADVEFSDAVLSLDIRKPGLPFFCVLADRELSEPSEIRHYLRKHLLGQVNWMRAMQTLTRSLSQNQVQFVEVGSSKTLKSFFATDHPRSEAKFSHCTDHFI